MKLTAESAAAQALGLPAAAAQSLLSDLSPDHLALLDELCTQDLPLAGFTSAQSAQPQKTLFLLDRLEALSLVASYKMWRRVPFYSLSKQGREFCFVLGFLK